MNGSEGNGLAIPEIGITQSRHQLSHHGGDPEVLARLAKSDAFIMQQFGYFLDKLKARRRMAASRCSTARWSSSAAA